MMDPLGLALENFDAVGKWRTLGESSEPIDASGVLPDGTKFDGPAGLRQALLTQSDRFVTTADREAADLRARPRRGVLRRARVRAIVREAARQRLPLLVG